MGSSFRCNDGEVKNRDEGAQPSSAWIPAFAGMTMKVVVFVGMTAAHRRTS